MKKLTRRDFTAAGILPALALAGAGPAGCTSFEPSENDVIEVYGAPADDGPFDDEGSEDDDSSGSGDEPHGG